MPAFDSGSIAVGYPISPDPRIAALQAKAVNGSHQVWLSTNLTYSFPNGAALFDGGLNYGNGEVRAGWTGLNATQQEGVRKALAAWSAVANITFTEVPDGTTVGDLRFAFTNAITGNEAAHAYQPVSGSASAGDVWLGNDMLRGSFNAATEPGNFQTLLHEIGHALGLSHPFASPGDARATAQLDGGWNATIMSYTPASALYGGTPVTPMPVDVAAIQYLYGTNFLYRTGNDTYTYDINNVNYETIWDVAGVDTLVVTNSANVLTLNTCYVDIRPGKISNIGFASTAASSYVVNVSGGGTNAIYRGSGVVALAEGVQIENVTATQNNDNITGNDTRNVISSGTGIDTIDGGGGIDTSVYASPRSSYTLDRTATGFTVTDNFITQVNASFVYTGKDTLTNVERLRFSDTRVALDLSGSAGTAAKVLGAVFGRSAVANKEYVGIALSLLDQGMTTPALVQLALNAKLGAGASNTAVVNLLYTNLTGAAPGSSELALYKGMLDSGTLSQANLGTIAAEHALNTTGINLVGLAGTGIEYL